jgi:peptide-methionine (R)-S-oxide reductase
MTHLSRRTLLHRAGALGLGLAVGTHRASAQEAPMTDRLEKPDAQWRQELTPEQYRVLREHGTERAFTSPLNDETRKGTFVCAGCRLPLFDAAAKYDSGTGWPSFWQPLPDAVGTSTDYKLIWPRTEVHCRRCGGHLGHVFDDGPAPTGKRYCMNGVAMLFEPAKD